ELSSEFELGSGRVLVVDDDPRISGLIAETLKSAGYDVATTPDGPAALAVARELDPDVIVFGLLLSGTTGFGTLSDIKGEPELANVPVVLVTMDSERSLGYALGATDYVEKSDPEQLTGAVGRQLGKDGLVLVVDDDPAVRDTLKRALERSGYEVETAADGEEALDRVVEVRPSLVLLDLMMPKVDGFEVLARLRDDDMLRDLPVLCFTARDLDGEERARLRRGMAKVLQKGGRGGEALLEEIRRQVASHIARTSQLPPDPRRQPLAP
ncbi:MAG: response regulator, partial [Myxococcota bacterium]